MLSSDIIPTRHVILSKLRLADTTLSDVCQARQKLITTIESATKIPIQIDRRDVFGPCDIKMVNVEPVLYKELRSAGWTILGFETFIEIW